MRKLKSLNVRKLALLSAVCVLVFAGAAGLELSTNRANASSHREAPSISQDPAADNTDTYLFRSPDNPGTVTLIANYYPYEGPSGGPNFYRFGDDVLYELHVDNDGDARDEITYQFRFSTSVQNPNTFLYNDGPIGSLTDPHWNVRQTYSVTRIQNGQRTVLGTNIPTPPSNVGIHSIPNYASLRSAAVTSIGNGIKVFAGQRADPFFADVGSIFDLLTIRGGIPAGFSSGGVNTFANYNLQTIALQVPIDQLTGCQCIPGPHDDPVIGFWASASRKSAAVDDVRSTGDWGDDSEAEWVQVSRLGLPLINEVVIPLGLKDKFNRSQPVNDVANFATPVLTPELASLLNVLYGLPIPPTPRSDLVEVLLKGVPGLNRPANVVPADMLRLNVNTPLCSTACNNLGVIGGDLQGFPNGRRLNDDVIDVSERVVAGLLNSNCSTPPCAWQGFPNNALGDGVNGPARSPMATFPYVPDPYDGFNY